MYVHTSIYNIVYINNIVYIYMCVCAYAISPQTRHSSSTLDTASRCRLECDWIAAGAIQLGDFVWGVYLIIGEGMNPWSNTSF